MRVLFFDKLEYAYAARFRREWAMAMPRPPKGDQMMRVAGSGPRWPSVPSRQKPRNSGPRVLKVVIEPAEEDPQFSVGAKAVSGFEISH